MQDIHEKSKIQAVTLFIVSNYASRIQIFNFNHFGFMCLIRAWEFEKKYMIYGMTYTTTRGYGCPIMVELSTD